jgi:beta-phosphoglucomutase-like phosphatase (HAD superfamily)
LDADPAAATLVGDSFTDIEAAHSAGVASIGYANKPGKRERMAELRAGAVITSVADLALSLRAHPAKSEL